jgi:DNA-binding transcriptional LysR family regulator
LVLLTIECDSSAILEAVVMGSDAVSMMCPFMLDTELSGGQLVMLPDLDLGIRARFGAAWIAGRTVSSATSAFVELLQRTTRRCMHWLRAMGRRFAAAGQRIRAAGSHPSTR